MAWTKAKVAAACIAALSLVAGTTAIVVQQVIARDTDGERITIDPSQDGINVTAKPRTITGTVKTPDGNPVAGAEVRLQRGAAGPVQFTTSVSPGGAVRTERVLRKVLDAPANPSSPQVTPFPPRSSPDAGVITEDVDVRVVAPREGRATIVLGTSAAPSAFPEAVLAFSSDAVVKTGADGTFTLETADPFGLVVARSEAGIAQVPLDQFTEPRDVVLQPWARVEGTLSRGHTPLANHTVTLTRGGFHRDQRQINTDDQGRFSFDKVPPGPALLTHAVPGADAAFKSLFPVNIKPGETLTLDLGRAGRDVKGRVAVPATQSSTATQVSLIGTLRWANPKGQQASAATSPLPAPDARTTFPIAPDGSFTLDHLWPGTYMLGVTRVERSSTSNRATPASPITFTITDNDPATPLDLGTLHWTTQTSR